MEVEAAQYGKFKAKNIRMNLKNDGSQSKHVLLSARGLSLGYVSHDGYFRDKIDGDVLKIGPQ